MPLTVYLDNNATTRLSERALGRISEISRSCFGNSSSMHQLGRNAHLTLEESRARFAEFLGHPAGMLFTSGGTESNVLCLLGALQDSKFEQVVISELEHISIHGFLEMKLPVPVVCCDTLSAGTPDLDHLIKLVAAKRSLVSMMHVNNETGVIFPVQQIAEITHQAGGKLHVDMAQSLGKIPVKEVAASSDAVTFSAHKFHGPLGVGGIAVMNPDFNIVAISPGGHQEGGIRSGTVNVPGIAGAAEALAECLEDPRPVEELASLRDALERFMEKSYPHCLVAAKETGRIWTTSFVCFPGILQDDLIEELSVRGIYVGKGAACASSLEGSRILRCMGIQSLYNQGGIRFSFSRGNTMAEVQYLLEQFPEAYSGAAARSPYA